MLRKEIRKHVFPVLDWEIRRARFLFLKFLNSHICYLNFTLPYFCLRCTTKYLSISYYYDILKGRGRSFQVVFYLAWCITSRRVLSYDVPFVSHNLGTIPTRYNLLLPSVVVLIELLMLIEIIRHLEFTSLFKRLLFFRELLYIHISFPPNASPNC